MRDIKALGWQTVVSTRIETKRLFGAMANRAPPRSTRSADSARDVATFFPGSADATAMSEARGVSMHVRERIRHPAEAERKGLCQRDASGMRV
jgi:hypothetical protein